MGVMPDTPIMVSSLLPPQGRGLDPSHILGFEAKASRTFL